MRLLILELNQQAQQQLGILIGERISRLTIPWILNLLNHSQILIQYIDLRSS